MISGHGYFGLFWTASTPEMHDCNASQFVVTNIHELASSAHRLLPQFPLNYFDMTMIDEGHDNVAPSWVKVFDRFPNAKVASLRRRRSGGNEPARSAR